MTIKELDAQLVEALETYKGEIKAQFPADSDAPATMADLHEASRQAFYAMDIMREKIIAYLRAQG